VQVRLKGYSPLSKTFVEGTTAEQGRHWGLYEAHKQQLGHVPTLAHEVLSEFTTEQLIKGYQQEVHIAQTAATLAGRQAYVWGKVVKRSWENENISLDGFMKHEHTLCSKPLNQVDTQVLEDYIDRRLASGIKGDSLRRELNPIRYIYKHFRKQNKISSWDPFKDLDLPKPDKGRDRLISDEERTRLLKATETFRGDKRGRLWTALIMAALTTAARRGELLKLLWEDINFEKKTLYFRAENTKTGNARLIPMSKYLYDVLKAYERLIPVQDKIPTSLVFQLTPTAHEQAWRRLCKRAEPPIKNLHFNDLRHTAATQFDVIDLSRSENEYMCGHKGGGTNARYVHAEIERIRAKLDIDYEPEEAHSTEVQTHDFNKSLTKVKKEAKDRLAKDKTEKIAVFRVKVSWPRFLWTPHCSMEPRRKEAHE
jgi:integrase